MDHSFDSNSEPSRRDDSELLKFLETLIDKLIKKLDEDSYKPRVQDVLKAIQLKQKVAETFKGGNETHRDEKSIWDEIETIRQEELPKHYPDPNHLESQIKATIFGLRFQVENGILPVKTITDTFNQGKSEENRLTYHRIGRLLSTLGFTKVKTSSGSSAILWNDNLLSQKKH